MEVEWLKNGHDTPVEENFQKFSLLDTGIKLEAFLFIIFIFAVVSYVSSALFPFCYHTFFFFFRLCQISLKISALFCSCPHFPSSCVGLIVFSG